MQHRTADEEACVGLLAVHLEVFFVAAVFGRRIERGGIDREPSLRIEHLDRAEVLGGRGMIEQDQVPDRLADTLNLRQHHVARDGAQREIVKFDVAADIGVDARGEVLKGLAGEFFLAAAHVEHDVDADGGETDDGHDRRDDQQLCR